MVIYMVIQALHCKPNSSLAYVAFLISLCVVFFFFFSQQIKIPASTNAASSLNIRLWRGSRLCAVSLSEQSRLRARRKAVTRQQKGRFNCA